LGGQHRAIELHDAIVQHEARVDQLPQSLREIRKSFGVRRAAEGLQFHARALGLGLLGGDLAFLQCPPNEQP